MGAISGFLVVIVPFMCVYTFLLLSVPFPRAGEPLTMDPRAYLEAQVSALVKVHKRADIAVRAAFSIYNLYPHIPIIMVDDSPTPISLPLPPSAMYFRIPEDTGISYGRNFGVAQINTRYTLLMDDDWLLTNDSLLEQAFTFMEANHSIGIVTGLLCTKDTRPLTGCYGYQGSLGIVDGLLTYKDKTYREDMVQDCKLVDLGENAMLARTDILKQYPWENKLKNAEHEDFFLTLKGAVNVASCPWFKILHKRPALNAYAGYQDDRDLWANQDILCKKWKLKGFNMMYTEWQRECPKE